MSLPEVVTEEKWESARRELLANEKKLTKVRDHLNTERRQLILYHFMFHAEWEEGCPSCTAGTDEISRGFLEHLHVRDTTSRVTSGRAVGSVVGRLWSHAQHLHALPGLESVPGTLRYDDEVAGAQPR